MTVQAGIGRRLADLFRDEMDKAVRDLAEATLERAKRDAPPSPPADEDPNPAVSLRDSGRVVKVRDGVYDIVFDTPYAAKIHEDFRLKHPRGGSPKYLEKNIQIAARELEGAIETGVRTVTKRNGSTRVSMRRF